MLSFSLSLALAVGLLPLVGSANAQPLPAGSASPPSLDYRSALARYRPFGEQPVAPWNRTNDTVGAIGGWRTYAKEARQPPPAKEGAQVSPNPGVKRDSPSPAPVPSPGAKP